IEDSKSSLQWSVEQIWLHEAERQIALILSVGKVHAQRFAQPEEVVRLIAQADERTRQPADATIQSDTVLTFFFYLQGDVDSVVLVIRLQRRILLVLQGFEIAQLIQPEQAQLPQA